MCHPNFPPFLNPFKKISYQSHSDDRPVPLRSLSFFYILHVMSIMRGLKCVSMCLAPKAGSGCEGREARGAKGMPQTPPPVAATRSPRGRGTGRCTSWPSSSLSTPASSRPAPGGHPRPLSAHLRNFGGHFWMDSFYLALLKFWQFIPSLLKPFPKVFHRFPP